MSENLPRTNRWLIALSVILCLILGGIFTRSSAVTSQADAISNAGAFVSEDQNSAEFTSEETLTDSNDNFTDSSSGKLFGRTSSDSSETSPGGPALSTEISPEASEGSWASSGSNWMFWWMISHTQDGSQIQTGNSTIWMRPVLCRQAGQISERSGIILIWMAFCRQGL